MENEKLQDKNSELDNIIKLGTSEDEGIHCISIIGQIEGHYILPQDQKATKYEHLIPLLASLEQDPSVKGVLLVLNTMGGDVEAGLAIAELIASMSKPSASLVLGGGHSIGVPLAVSARRSFIVPSATMTIHPVRVSGMVVGAPQTYYYFERMQDRIISFVCAHSNIKEEKLRNYMMCTDQIATDTGSIIDGREAVESGLIDSLGGLTEALSYLREEIKSKEKEAD